MPGFPNTLQKVHEASHFLILMRLAELPDDGGLLPRELVGHQAFKFAFSAFLSAARAVPYLLQEEGATVPGFTRWYVSAREQLLNDKLTAFFSNKSRYRILFSDETVDLEAAPTGLTNLQVEPVDDFGFSPRAVLQDLHGDAKFEGQPAPIGGGALWPVPGVPGPLGGLRRSSSSASTGPRARYPAGGSQRELSPGERTPCEPRPAGAGALHRH